MKQVALDSIRRSVYACCSAYILKVCLLLIPVDNLVTIDCK